MANALNDTTILDNKLLSLGTDLDLNFIFDTADNRVEIRDASSNVRGHITAAGVFTWAGTITASGLVSMGSPVTHTIATGAITITSSRVKLDTEAAASTDDLDTISGGSDGMIATLRTTSSSRDVVVRNLGGGTGNIQLNGGANYTLANRQSTLTLMYDADTAVWIEIARSAQ